MHATSRRILRQGFCHDTPRLRGGKGLEWKKSGPVQKRMCVCPGRIFVYCNSPLVKSPAKLCPPTLMLALPLPSTTVKVRLMLVSR